MAPIVTKQNNIVLILYYCDNNKWPYSLLRQGHTETKSLRHYILVFIFVKIKLRIGKNKYAILFSVAKLVKIPNCDIIF